MALLLYRPGGYILEWFGYYLPNVSFVALSDQGAYPFIHYWMEYPPIFPWLAVIVYRLSLLLPPWNDPRLWYQLGMGLALLPFEVGSLLLVYRIAGLWQSRDEALRSAWFYALLFAPLFTWLGWFDPLPLFFLLLALYLAVTRRPVGTGLAVGLGFMTKLLPVLMLPIAWRTLGSRRDAARATVSAAVGALAVALPFLLIRPDLLVASFISPLKRGPWETVWALLDGYYSGGVVVPLADRFDPASARVALHPSHLPWPAITLAFGVIGLFLYLRPFDWHQPRQAVAFAGLTVNLFMLWSKGYSPQFIIYLLPFVALLLPDLRGGTYAVLLSLTNLAEWPIAQLMLPQEHALFAAVISFRAVLLIALTLEYGAIVYGAERTRRLLRFVPVALTLLAVTGCTLAAPHAYAAYRTSRLEADPYREAIRALTTAPSSPLLFADRDLYRHFYPYLASGQTALLMTSEKGRAFGLPRLANRTDAVWLIDGGTAEASLLRDWLDDNGYPAGGQWFDNLRVDLYGLGSTRRERSVGARFSSGVRLVSWAYGPDEPKPGDVIRLRLDWETERTPEIDWHVFVHVVGADARPRAQHDSIPGAGRHPTTTWRPGQRITDPHGILLPADLPPGRYTLIVGLYDPATGQRLTTVDGQDHVSLTQITIRPKRAASGRSMPRRRLETRAAS
jgi:hypothetical protein